MLASFCAFFIPGAKILVMAMRNRHQDGSHESAHDEPKIAPFESLYHLRAMFLKALQSATSCSWWQHEHQTVGDQMKYTK